MRTSLAVLTLCAAAFAPAHASVVQLITNGTFETGNLSGWTAATAPPYMDVTGSCHDGFAASSTNSGCISGIAPVDGIYDADMSASFPAVSDNVGEWDDSLSQNFVDPTGTISNAMVQFDDTATCTGSGTFRGCGVFVDLYQGANFLNNFYTLVNPGANTTDAWATYDWDVTSILQSYQGQTLTLELATFAFYDTRGTESSSSATALNAAFDNVQLNVTSPTPEPATFGLIGAGLLLAGVFARRSTSRRIPSKS